MQAAIGQPGGGGGALLLRNFNAIGVSGPVTARIVDFDAYRKLGTIQK
jgi:hypothetical protein